MNKIKNWSWSTLCVLLSLLTVSCSMEGGMEYPSGTGGHVGSSETFIQITFGMVGARGTRANPTGGEQGDGLEAGQDYENHVGSAVAFLFDGSLTINGPADTKVTAVAFNDIKSVQPTGGYDAVYETEVRNVTLDRGVYNLILVVNPGDGNWWNGLSTLGEVRDHILQKAWTENGEGAYTNFLMTSAGEPTIYLELEYNTADHPATALVEVERMAARVDYKANNQYTCADNAYAGATVEITGAAIINRFTAGSYLLKRVAADVSETSTVTYLGNETLDGQGLQTNYVIDPWTVKKNSGNANRQDTPFAVNGTQTNAEGLYAKGTYYPTFSDNPAYWDECCNVGTAMNGESEGWRRVGYTLENTTAAGETSRSYNTGIAFKARFHPQGLDGYTDGHTFFSYRGTLYATLTGMMESLNGQRDFAAYVGGKINEAQSWGDITAFANTIIDPTGYASYLKANANQQGDFSRESVTTWTSYLNNVLGVTENAADGPLINQNGVANTRALLYDSSNEQLRTFYKGQCYYVWWLRHSNDGDDAVNGLMEYAVVRNNIYKVSVESIYTLGGDIPDSEDIRVFVYVNKWMMLDEEFMPM